MSEFISELIEGREIINLKELKILWFNNTVWITNYIKIITYQPTQIVLKIKNNQLIICGDNLKIVSMEPKELVLKGKIDSIQLEKKFLTENK